MSFSSALAHEALHLKKEGHQIYLFHVQHTGPTLLYAGAVGGASG